MRELLFRGKNELDEKEWLYGNLEDRDGELHITKWFKRKSGYLDSDAAIVLPETVGQFTGLTDKNGKKIFEGDIVKCYRYANGKGGELIFENLVVVWDDMDACFCLAEVGVWHISYRYNDYQMDDTHEFEVIGNIHDNPELLADKT